MTMRAGRIHGRGVALALTLATATLGFAGSPALAGPFVGFSVTIGQASFEGTANANTTFEVIVTGKDGAEKGRETVTADADGDWSFPGGLDANVEIGDVFRAKSGQSTIERFTVPVLSVAGDRVADRVSGRAPAGSILSVGLVLCPVAGASSDLCSATSPVEVTSNARGRWALDLSGSAPDGGDGIRAVWVSGRDRVTIPAIFPSLVVTPGAARLEGIFRPEARTSATLERGGQVAARARIRGFGWYGVIYTLLRDAGGAPEKVRVGDRVSAGIAGDARLRVRAISATVTESSAAATGTCLPNRAGVIQGRLTAIGSFFAVAFTADGAGDWSATLPSPADVGATWTVLCATPAGDVLRASGEIPLP